MRKLLIFFALTALTAIAGDFLPLQSGNEWTYREAKSGQTITVRVGTPVQMNDLFYYPLNGYGAQRLFVRVNQYGNIVAVDPETYREQLLISFEPVDRAWWVAPYRFCEQEGQTPSKRGEHDGPAGPIREVLDIRYRSYGCADVGSESEQFAENIGMVRRVESSIAGPRVFDLVAARVGHQTIRADQHGRFTVSVRELPGSDELQIQLELNIDPAGETRLQFYSGQQYDVQIRNSAARVVWQWSEGQEFSQALSDRLVNGRWVITVTAPRPTVTLPESNRFTVNAWLPTVGGNQFAASTPFELSTKAQ